MIPYDEAIAQLKKWKNESTPVFMHWSFGGVSGWCKGVLKLAGSAELHFGIETIDGKDFLFLINVHRTYNPQFRFMDNRESFQFFAPQRELTQFGKVLEITSQGSGRVILAEIFSKAIEV
jgi:hypothetical protein